MEAFAAGAERMFWAMAQMGVTLLEFCGVVVLVIASVKALIGFFRRDARVRLRLAQGGIVCEVKEKDYGGEKDV